MKRMRMIERAGAVRKGVKTALVLASAALPVTAVRAQEATGSDGEKTGDKVEATIATDLVSQYYWRGQELGKVSVQPTLGIGWKGLSLTAWGSVGLSDFQDTREFDLTAAYEVRGFHVGVTDYWFDTPRKKYFAYRNNNTSHVFEGNVGYDFGFLTVDWYTNFAGNDGENKDGKRAYSSYVELGSPFRLGGIEWNASVGAVPYATTFYSKADGFAVTHVAVRATKEIRVTQHFGIPLFAQIAANPSAGKAYFVAGFTLQAL